jgi:hypothetical protein
MAQTNAHSFNKFFSSPDESFSRPQLVSMHSNFSVCLFRSTCSSPPPAQVKIVLCSTAPLHWTTDSLGEGGKVGSQS